MELVLSILIGALVGAGVLYVIIKPRLKATQELDEATKLQNEELHTELVALEKQHVALTARRQEIQDSISLLEKQAAESSDAIYRKSWELANEKMSNASEVMSKQYEQAKQIAENDYLETLKDCANSFTSQINDKKNELKKVQDELTDLVQKLNSAVEANKRAEEIKQKQDFYRLQLTAIDLDEIKRLREVEPYLREKEPLNKVIWKVYYEKPYADLVGRVIGPGIHTGIYKITNIENQMCYVGQAVNIADRWKQHIKRGIGAEAPTRNKLYPAMLELGVENFTFEIVEECDKSKLNEREDYWQEFFHAKDFGYSIK